MYVFYNAQIDSERFFICEQKKKGENPEKDYDSAVWKAAETKRGKIPNWGKNRGKVTSLL